MSSVVGLRYEGQERLGRTEIEPDDDADESTDSEENDEENVDDTDDGEGVFRVIRSEGDVCPSARERVRMDTRL